jgi:isoquinoline 1-oxidoreductase beta subunit
MSPILNVTRRDFLRTGSAAGAGLVLGFYLPSRNGNGSAFAADGAFQPNAWLQIATDGKVKIWCGKSEMGQGPRTALPMIVAEELDADWGQVEVVQAYYDRKYGNQGTGGSTSVRTSWEPLRKAGATGRAMLLGAAAQQWGVEVSTCRAEKGVVTHAASGRKLTYGQLAEAAGKLEVPKEAALKEPKDFHLVGRELARTDTPPKVTGQAAYGIDVRLPGMLYASVQHCPVFGGKVVKFDGSKAKAVAGVKQVVQTSKGVAVVAENSWAAFRGRAALDVTWDEGPHAGDNSEMLHKQMEDLTAKPAKQVRNDGDVEAALGAAAKRVEAMYELPFLSHSPMEPMNCTAHVTADRCEVWAPTQAPAWVHRTAKQITALPDEKIRVNVTLLGGGFGRRWFQGEVEDAIEVAKLVGQPVQLIWTREDDTQHGFYRPVNMHRLAAGLDAAGWPVAWHHRLASTSILTSLQPDTKTPEATEIGGAADFPYMVPNVRVEYASASSHVPRGWLRSVEHSFNAFVVQSFLDELAHAAGKDPYEYRMHLLREPRKLTYDDETLDTARLRRVLEVAAEKAGWGKPLPKGRGRGLAHHWSFHSYVAQVAEVTVGGDDGLRVDRVVCAVDCGTVVNPNILRAQLEGGIVYGLAGMFSEITIERGRVVQSNFHDYAVPRMQQAPKVEVYVVPSTLPPTGVGEPGAAPAPAAVANAIFAATGKRIRKLPFAPEALA